MNGCRDGTLDDRQVMAEEGRMRGFDVLPRDVSANVARLLSVQDVRALVRANRSLYSSVFRERLVEKVHILVPPNGAVAKQLVDGIDSYIASCATSVVVTEARHLPLVASKFTRIKALRVSGDGLLHDQYEPVLDLPCIEQLTQLRCLDLSSSTIIGISSLSRVTWLTELDLSFTVVQDITPLQAMIQLQVLNLEKTRVKSIETVTSMPELRVLNLNSTSWLFDLSPLKQLQKLQHLSINDKELIEVESLVSVAGSLTMLDAVDVKFPAFVEVPDRQDALSALRALESLQTWPLSWVQSLDPLRPLSKLKKLDLRFPPFSDLSPLQLLTDLEDLHLLISATRDTSPLRVLKKLKRVVLTGCSNNPQRLEFLTHLPELRDLSLSGEIHTSTVASLTGLQTLALNYFAASWASVPPADRLPQSMWTNLKSVTRLSLRFPVGIPADLSTLACMTQLEALDLRYATPKELPTPDYFQFLQSLVNLQELRLASGGIKDLFDLANLAKLQYLDLSSTSIDSVEQLTGLTALQNLELLYTNVSDVTPLTKLPRLQRVSLPSEVSCCPLIEADLPELRVILHEHLNCIWNENHRREYESRQQDEEMVLVDADDTLEDLELAFGDYTGDY